MPVFAGMREGVAVIADNVWNAIKARKLLKVEWDETGIEPVDTEQLFDRMRKDLVKPGLTQRQLGDSER